jgi:hypothetical protein
MTIHQILQAKSLQFSFHLVKLMRKEIVIFWMNLGQVDKRLELVHK